jgi:isoquinoline 1-oxidoreductase alpha subunit
MAPITIYVNGIQQNVPVSGDAPLLWVLRESLGLTGTKFGCGMALCGACTVHVDGEAVRACVTPISEVAGKHVTTIEGLTDGLGLTIQRAWVEEDVPQYGYRQPGQVMAAAALLRKNRRPTTRDMNVAMSGNLCRCGTYQRIRRAIERAAKVLSQSEPR